MIRSMLYHNSHMFRHTIRNILDSQNIEHQLLYNYSNLEAFHETFKRKILQIIEIYIWLFTFIISRIIINRIRINIREHRRITKIYGGAKLRFESFKLLIPPGKKVLGYLTNEKKTKVNISFLFELILPVHSSPLYTNHSIKKKMMIIIILAYDQSVSFLLFLTFSRSYFDFVLWRGLYSCQCVEKNWWMHLNQRLTWQQKALPRNSMMLMAVVSFFLHKVVIKIILLLKTHSNIHKSWPTMKKK